MSSKVLKGTLVVCYGGALAFLLYFAYAGASYYLTPLIERPRHPDYWLLKPGGSRGLLFGIIGAGLMTAMLLYSVRKRVPGLRRFAQLRLWLHFHIFCGVIGPLFIVLHSSFKVQGLVSLSFWSMVIVALSGFVGRFLYVQIPRRRSGDELTLAETVELGDELHERLKHEFHLSDEQIEELERISRRGIGGREDGAPAFRPLLLLQLPYQNYALRRRLRRFQRGLEIPAGSVMSDLTKTLSKAAVLERRVALWSEIHRLFYYWHLFHKPFSIIMYVFMVVHIAVAVATGYASFG